MGVASTELPPSYKHSEEEIQAIPSSMSQGFHEGNIYSFSDEFERPQTNHVAQQSRRDKLRVQQHEFAAAAAGHPLVTIQEGEEEAGGIYGPAGTSYMLSEMFNFPAPPAADPHRQFQQRPEFYGGNRQDQVTPSSAVTPSEFYGMNPDSSATAMRMFFMNPESSSAVTPSGPSTPMGGGQGVGSSLHHHFHHGQPFLGHSFGESVSFAGGGGGVMDRQQLGPSLSLSSSALHQLEMRNVDDEMSIRQRQEQQLHPNSIQQLPQPPAPPGQLVHMSYGPMATVNVFRNSKYARAAQDLLEEFCSVGRGQARGSRSSRNSSINPNPGHSRGAASAPAASSSSSRDLATPLSSSDRFECQRKKSKLLSMIDEVERRYNHYCEQMQMVVNSFDTVMGFGAATPYTALAQKAMSRHFRCLKDAISAQLRHTCELLGDKDGGGNVSGGLTKGETPKLRLIDQSLRQQRAFHQLGMMDQDQAWRPQRGLPDRSVTILRAWLFDHFLHPYPSDADKHLLARQTGLSRNQVSNWFINARVRLWKPMVEDMYQQEARDEEDSQHNEEDTNKSQGRMLPAGIGHHHHQSLSAIHHQTLLSQNPDSDAPETVSVPRQNPRLADGAQQPPPPPPPPEGNDAVFSAGSLDDDMYRRAAAMLSPSAAAQARFGSGAVTAARTGDLSLTLGLRHAGGNPPETGRFGL